MGEGKDQLYALFFYGLIFNPNTLQQNFYLLKNMGSVIYNRLWTKAMAGYRWFCKFFYRSLSILVITDF